MKTIAITWVSSGIGKALFELLAWAWYTMIGIVRHDGEEYEKRVRSLTWNENVRVFSCDLSLQSDIVRSMGEIEQWYKEIDILIHNAWVYSETRRETEEGIEMTLAVNVIAPFLVTERLLPLLTRAQWKVYMIGSIGERYGKIDWSDLMNEHHYSGNAVYNESKLLLTLLTYAFATHFLEHHLSFFVIHPGPTSTSLIEDSDVKKMPWYLRIIFTLVRRFRQTPWDAAETIREIITAPHKVETALFFVNGKPVSSSETSYDVRLQENIWNICHDLTSSHRN